MSDTPTVRTHAHRVTEASFIVGNEAAILGALEGRDREIEALRARVGWEVAERDREARARNVTTAVDLDAIEARLNAVEGVPLRHVLLVHAPEDLRTLLAEVRRLTDALATACLDGARAMREAAADHLLAPERRMAYVQAGPRCLAVAAAEIRTLDPAAVVGSVPKNARAAYRVGFDDGIEQAVALLRRDEQHKRTIAAQPGTEPDDRTRMLHVADGLEKMAAIIGEIRPTVVGSGS